MDPKITFKCKPCWKFQTIEFEVQASIEELPKVADLYKKVVDELVRIAPEQTKEVAQREPLATEKQKQIMKTHDIPFDATTTQAQAQVLIQKSMEASKK